MVADGDSCGGRKSSGAVDVVTWWESDLPTTNVDSADSVVGSDEFRRLSGGKAMAEFNKRPTPTVRRRPAVQSLTVFIYVLWLAHHSGCRLRFESSPDLVCRAIGRHLCVAEQLAGRFLDAALNLFDRTLNAIFVHDVILRELMTHRVCGRALITAMRQRDILSLERPHITDAAIY